VELIDGLVISISKGSRWEVRVSERMIDELSGER
jgi:uncharacterized membrane protein